MASWADDIWWEGPARELNPYQPFAAEFPGLLCWDPQDENVSRLLTCQVPYLRGRELGVGGFAKVYKVLRKTDGSIFAGKTSNMTEKLREEARILRQLNDVSPLTLYVPPSSPFSQTLIKGQDHILRCEGLYEDEDAPEATMLLTEICAGGNLNTHINNSTGGMAPGQILRVIVQVAAALDYLHGQSLFHSDVKPKNIFIRSFRPMNVALGDCADVKSVPYGGKLEGTPRFYSPEMVSNKRNTGPADDVWALGVGTLMMVNQQPRMRYVRESRRDVPQLREYTRRCIEHAAELSRLNPGHGIVTLMGRMLAGSAQQRITAGELRVAAGDALERWVNEHGGEDGELGIKAPEGFRPVEFW
ncbi:Serine/threonine-protein kinase-like protein [Hapsidospora chrysogenum ATCC 11550]|uniref:non-specific serine/threonine protein kinase n=1 Tax=Hapsidospora chrysogenum (strain ATCC 11550 / CBS 779.69 / DSM 880 / IAM 14645 / JCM 23072 / IMI 49137) TaxID=857340 RepID=A0A086TGD3_HAPC1|nr:Serine/threonine-protein kinase-like protein [Hapsidospora chrysogenum ATCC 11550]